MTSFLAQDLFNLDGAIALVTGGGTGIGLMAAKALAANGAKVYITGRRMPILEQAVKVHGRGMKGSLHAIQADVNSKEDLQKVKSQISEGRLHVLVNNAGIIGPETKIEGKDKMTPGELSQAMLDNEDVLGWDQVLRTNTTAVFFTTMTLLPLLEAGSAKPPSSRSNGDWTCSIINVTSISGIVKVCQSHFAYNASKAATNSLTMMLAHELKFATKSNIRVNALAPGLFPSEMTSRGGLSSSKDGITEAEELSHFPMIAGRPGKAEEMASGILFLATNTFTTGQILAIDGGNITAHPSSR